MLTLKFIRRGDPVPDGWSIRDYLWHEWWLRVPYEHPPEYFLIGRGEREFNTKY